jgi:small subunit ribosomal protein S6
VKRYEALFILNTAGKEETIKEMIDKLSAEVTAAGGKLETVQKMDRKPFARVADKRHNAGFYVNVIFQAEPSVLDSLRHRFDLNEDVFRMLVNAAPAPAPAADAGLVAGAGGSAR